MNVKTYVEYISLYDYVFFEIKAIIISYSPSFFFFFTGGQTDRPTSESANLAQIRECFEVQLSFEDSAPENTWQVQIGEHICAVERRDSRHDALPNGENR